MSFLARLVVLPLKLFHNSVVGLSDVCSQHKGKATVAPPAHTQRHTDITHTHHTSNTHISLQNSACTLSRRGWRPRKIATEDPQKERANDDKGWPGTPGTVNVCCRVLACSSDAFPAARMASVSAKDARHRSDHSDNAYSVLLRTPVPTLQGSKIPIKQRTAYLLYRQSRHPTQEQGQCPPKVCVCVSITVQMNIRRDMWIQ